MNSNANNKKNPVRLFVDISGFIIVILIVLYLLFPKDRIEDILEKELKHNNNLSVDYLESMMQHSVHNMDLEKKLVEQYQHTEEFDKGLALNQKFLKENTDKKELNFLYKQEYLLLKSTYFKEIAENKKENPQQLMLLKNKLQNLFNYAKSEEDYQFLFKESNSMDFQTLKYSSLQALLKMTSVQNRDELEREAFLLAYALNKKDEAYGYVSSILKREDVSPELQKQAFSFLLDNKYFSEAEVFAIEFMKNEKNHEKKVENFKTAFYILAQHREKNSKKIEELIQLYQEGNPLDTQDLILLSNTYLQINKKEKAANLLYENLKNNKENFDESFYHEAIKILSYASQLPRALEVADSVYSRYPTVENLDKRITFSTWLNKMEEVIKLNEDGWRKFGEEKYKAYLFKRTSLDNSYKIQGEISKQEVEQGNFSMVKKLKEYFEHTGEIPKAEAYFQRLLKRYPNEQSIHKEAIRFSHYNSHYKEAQKLYADYREKYGMDKELNRKMMDESLALKDLKSAYLFAKEVGPMKAKPSTQPKVKVKLNYVGLTAVELHNMKLTQMAWIEKDYSYLHTLLWKEEALFSKSKNSYDRLILLEKNLEKEPRLEYLYSKAWKVTHKQRHLFSLLSFYIDKKMYTKFNSVLVALKEEDITRLEQEPNYHILLANYYRAVDQKGRALEAFHKALSLDSKSSAIHEAYLWFLVDNSFREALSEELDLLNISSGLRKEIAFPSVVAALKLDKSDLALKWIKPILKEHEERMEYLLLYADILDHQGREREAKAIRLKLFRRLDAKVKASPRLLKDKEFAHTYLQMALLQNGSYVKKMAYIEQLKSLFTDEEYLEITLGWYVYADNMSRVKDLASEYKSLFPKRELKSWIKLYMATKSRDKEAQKRVFEKYKEELSLKDKIFLSRNLGNREDAYRLLFEGMNYNRNDMNLFNTYWDMVNEDYPKNSLTSKAIHLSPDISLLNFELTQGFNIFKDINLEFGLNQSRFFDKSLENKTDNSLSFALSNRHDDFLWQVEVGQNFGDEDFSQAKLQFQYSFDMTTLMMDANYNSRTTLTPKLQMYGLEKSIGFGVEHRINKRNILGTRYLQSEYTLEDGTYQGEGEVFALTNSYLLRMGYPNIDIYSHISFNHYRFIEESNIGLTSFSEIGTELSIGTTAKERLGKTLKPYMSAGAVINDHNQLGFSLSIGAAMMLFGADKLDVSFNYNKGINNLNEEIYDVGLEYKY